MFKFFDPKSVCIAQYNAFCSHIFGYACSRRKAYRYRGGSKLWKNCIHQKHFRKWLEDAYPSSYSLGPSLAISYRNHHKSLAYFSHLAPLVLFFFTKRRSQMGGGSIQCPIPLNTLLLTAFTYYICLDMSCCTFSLKMFYNPQFT